MKIFDRIDPLDLNRRQWHLWLLALTIILVLAVGMALLMYPTVFSNPMVVAGSTQRQAFFGFCTLAFLLMGYLVDRQVVIKQLHTRLEEERQLIVRIRQEASSDLLTSLQGFDHFRDSLAMEYRRAVTTNQSLSFLVISLRASRSLAETTETPIAFGDAAKALSRKLRGEDSIYLLAPGVFCIVLPGVDTTNAYRVSGRLTEGLQDASGASSRFTFDVRVFNYPEHAGSAREIEQTIHSLLPAKVSTALGAESEAKAAPTP